MVRVLASALVVAAMCCSLLLRLALAAPPVRAIPYSGHLDLDGVAVSASLPMTFMLYSQASDGTTMFEQSENVRVMGGNFAVVLGTQLGNALPAEALTSTKLYLEIAVNGGTLKGRQQIFAAAQAVRAGQADDFTVSNALSAGVVRTGQVHGGNGSGNLHIDANNPAGADGKLYLNCYSGNGVIIGNGAQAQRVATDNAGNLSATGTVYAGGVSTGGTVSAGAVISMGNISAPNIVSTTGKVFAGLYKHDCSCPADHNVLGGGASCETGYMAESRPNNAST